MTVAPWLGTVAGGGDASYQLAFYDTAVNAVGVPKLAIRSGIDSTWSSWYEVIHSNVIGNYAPSLTGTGATGTGWGISITGSAATVTGATQSAITSVGTLTAVTVTGATTTNGGIVNNGGDSEKYSAVSGNTTLDTTYNYVGVATASSALTITLPAVASSTGRLYTIFDKDGQAATRNITVNAQYGEYINGANGVALNVNWESMSFFCNGARWIITAKGP